MAHSANGGGSAPGGGNKGTGGGGEGGGHNGNGGNNDNGANGSHQVPATLSKLEPCMCCRSQHDGSFWAFYPANQCTWALVPGILTGEAMILDTCGQEADGTAGGRPHRRCPWREETAAARLAHRLPREGAGDPRRDGRTANSEAEEGLPLPGRQRWPRACRPQVAMQFAKRIAGIPRISPENQRITA